MDPTVWSADWREHQARNMGQAAPKAPITHDDERYGNVLDLMLEMDDQ
jgi:hypothetical protein